MTPFSFGANSKFLTVAAVLALASFTGCGGSHPKLGRVSGKVTLGGQPLADALILFSPTAAGSQSAGRTDSNGVYTLVYARNLKGAEVGEHNVTMTTFADGVPDSDPPKPEIPEKVPLKYRLPGELKATVKSGSNNFDFALEPGPIEEPKPEKGKGKKKSADGCF